MAGFKHEKQFKQQIRNYMRRRGLPFESPHRAARMLRFVYRHPTARGHADIIRRLEEERAAREVARREEFRARGY